ncbi:phosphotransferase [Vallitalea pronyensis]|uniref:Phosphotransferase n=1 Tax=Vallitalea pronyensis TaxID=1348613 RepID=A0A8J8MLH0_9FIRM|nr:phosphotransferase [Vallitalea pronyensis]QUI23587.1 phosphotransferase [Vallitalea pronyensis]
MAGTQYNLQFERLCQALQLGRINGTPEAISGGLLHRMYGVETTQGKYAIKALNPQVMLRPTARRHMIDSERVATIASRRIPVSQARMFNGRVIQEIDNQFYLVFDWVNGRSLNVNEINSVHSEKMGVILADLHQMDFSNLGIKKDSSDYGLSINWNWYLQKGRENNLPWVNMLNESMNKLDQWTNQGNVSAKLLSSNLVISHRDLDAKNVMWNADNPIIIDWESAGYVNPMLELTETAVYWSETENGDIDKKRYLAFIRSYKKRYGTLKANWNGVLCNGFLSKLAWLEYNLKRSLWIECSDTEEQYMGTIQVTDTIDALRRYANNIIHLENYLNYEID